MWLIGSPQMTPLRCSSVTICATTPSSILSCNCFLRFGWPPFLSTPLNNINLPALLNIMSGTFHLGAAVGIGAEFDFFGLGRILFTESELLDFQPTPDKTGWRFPELEDST